MPDDHQGDERSVLFNEQDETPLVSEFMEEGDQHEPIMVDFTDRKSAIMISPEGY